MISIAEKFLMLGFSLCLSINMGKSDMQMLSLCGLGTQSLSTTFIYVSGGEIIQIFLNNNK